MARRMFSEQIIDSDAFLDMPASAQNLYFHLGMRADDDGFLGNPKKVGKICGANDDDLRILIGKRFLLAFGNGVVVIKHWLIHNMIRADRYTETAYKEEKAKLVIKENRAYTEREGSDPAEVKEIPLIERPEWIAMREKAMKESSLPYSFSYKIVKLFWGKKCPICKVEMEDAEMSKKCIPTIQHNIPLSKGGKHELGNISIICHNCNITIGDEEYKDLNSEEVTKAWESIGNQSPTDAQPRLGKGRVGKGSKKITPKGVTAEPSKVLKQYGRPDINTVIGHLTERLGGSPDGSQKENRNFANLLIGKIKKDYPQMDPAKAICKIIDIGIEDKFHGKNITSFKYLFYNVQKIIQSAKENFKNPKTIIL